MKTKEQIIEFVATELKHGNSVIITTLDIMESEYIEEVSEIYQFSGGNGYKVQILTY